MARGGKTKYTIDQKARAIVLRSYNKDYGQIEEETGIPKKTVSSFFSQYGQETKKAEHNRSDYFNELIDHVMLEKRKILQG